MHLVKEKKVNPKEVTGRKLKKGMMKKRVTQEWRPSKRKDKLDVLKICTKHATKMVEESRSSSNVLFVLSIIIGVRVL